MKRVQASLANQDSRNGAIFFWQIRNSIVDGGKKQQDNLNRHKSTEDQKIVLSIHKKALVL